MVNNSLDIEGMLNSALTSERLSSMKLEKLEKSDGELYSFILQSTGDREGLSDIRIRQSNGDIILEDRVSLPKDNQGFEEDIVLLKKSMYGDLGAVASGDVRNLCYRATPIGHILSFIVSKEKAKKALHHYIDIASEVMGEFFRGYGEIDLAFSLARERVGR